MVSLDLRRPPFVSEVITPVHPHFQLTLIESLAQVVLRRHFQRLASGTIFVDEYVGRVVLVEAKERAGTTRIRAARRSALPGHDAAALLLHSLVLLAGSEAETRLRMALGAVEWC